MLWTEENGHSRSEKRKFSTFTRELLELADWLRQCGVTHVATESTGVYWKLVWHILEGQFELLLANSQHVKVISGHKTDPRDAAWVAELLQYGMLRGSFVPPEPIQGLRDLMRYRVNLAQECNRVANRIQKVLDVFRDEATIMIATEAAAEGINLQSFEILAPDWRVSRSDLKRHIEKVIFGGILQSLGHISDNFRARRHSFSIRH